MKSEVKARDRPLMATLIRQGISTTERPVSEKSRPAGYFFGPAVDFLLLGGASLILLPLAILLPANAKPIVLAITTVVALVINHPHFANSYQLFYRGFRAKAFGAEQPRGLRLRYGLAGLVVPAAL